MAEKPRMFKNTLQITHKLERINLVIFMGEGADARMKVQPTFCFYQNILYTKRRGSVRSD